MLGKPFSCPCQNAFAGDTNNLFADFSTLRDQCAALRLIFLPDGIWPNFVSTIQDDVDAAQHRPILFFAFERGYLHKLTFPIHHYLLEGDQPKPELTNQYRQDLRECWMMKTIVNERHQRSRGYLGKLFELLCAIWLEEQGWKVTGLEALGSEADIEAIAPDDVEYAVQVKYIGQEDHDFEMVVKSLMDKPSADIKSPYLCSDYLLFRVYEASKQLEQSTKKRMVLVIVSNLTWPFAKIPIQENWMHWDNPRFFNNHAGWLGFLRIQRRRYPHIEEDLPNALNCLNALWIVREESNLTFSLVEERYV